MAIVDWINKTNDFLDTNKYSKVFGGSALLPAIGSGVFNAVFNSSGNHTGIGDTINTISSMMPGVGGLIGTGVGTLTNTLFGSNINQGFVDATENSIDNLNNYYSTATDTTSLMNDWNNAGFMSHVSKDDVGTEGLFSNKATNTTNRLNKNIDMANTRAYNALFNTAQNINKNNVMYALASQHAYGGPLTMRYTGTMSPFGNQFSEGGSIHIKPENRGKFTALKERTGKSSTWFKEHGTPAQRKMATFALNAAKWHGDGGPLDETTLDNINDHPLALLVKALVPTGISSYYDVYKAGKEFYENPSVLNAGALGFEAFGAIPLVGKLGKAVKIISKGRKSVDAIDSAGKLAEQMIIRTPGMVKDGHDMRENPNYKDWPKKKSEGGPLFTHGSIWDNGITFINKGGTHEENPYDGVPMGVDNQGIPNLVEEGEVIWNDYVFSNRLKVPNKVNKKYSLKNNSTFAEAIKKLTKESKEMPNDPITRRGIDAIASEFAEAQEVVRAKKGSNNRSNIFHDGSRMRKPWEQPLNLTLPSVDDLMKNTVTPKSGLKSLSEIIQDTKDSNYIEPIKDDPLRKTSIGASGLAVLNDWLGGNEPDYSNLNVFENAIKRSYQPVQARRLTQQMTYKPFDTERAINRMNANTAASLRTALDISGGNRAAALAGLNTIANNYNNSVGDLYAKADEVNLTNLARALEFNKSIDAYNAEQATKADMYNSELLGKQANMYSQLASAKQKILEANRLEKMNNLTNFIQNLSALGRENTDRDTLRWLAQTGAIAYGPNGRFKGQ